MINYVRCDTHRIKSVEGRSIFGSPLLRDDKKPAVCCYRRLYGEDRLEAPHKDGPDQPGKQHKISKRDNRVHRSGGS